MIFLMPDGEPQPEDVVFDPLTGGERDRFQSERIYFQFGEDGTMGVVAPDELNNVDRAIVSEYQKAVEQYNLALGFSDDDKARLGISDDTLRSVLVVATAVAQVRAQEIIQQSNENPANIVAGILKSLITTESQLVPQALESIDVAVARVQKSVADQRNADSLANREVETTEVYARRGTKGDDSRLCLYNSGLRVAEKILAALKISPSDTAGGATPSIPDLKQNVIDSGNNVGSGRPYFVKQSNGGILFNLPVNLPGLEGATVNMFFNTLNGNFSRLDIILNPQAWVRVLEQGEYVPFRQFGDI